MIIMEQLDRLKRGRRGRSLVISGRPRVAQDLFDPYFIIPATGPR